MNYTWAKTIDNASADGSGTTANLDNNNLRLSRAISDAHRAHTFNWTVSYTLPIGRGKLLGRNMPDWLDRVAGGWEIGSLGILSSGAPFTVNSGVLTGPNNGAVTADYAGTDRGIGKVERIGAGVQFFTPAQNALFTVAAPGSIGSSGRNAFIGPGFFNTDLSLVKKFRVTERVAAIFRAEAYDLLNTVNFKQPNQNIQTPTSFGRISGTPTGASNQSGARILQGALRIEF